MLIDFFRKFSTSNKLRFLLSLVALIVLTISCSDKKTYDKAKAISAFALNEEIKIDKEAEKIEIKIPSQLNNYSWPQELSSQERIENFLFSSQKKDKFLNNRSQIWSGYKPYFLDRFVFAPIIKDNKIFLLDASGILSSYDLSNKKKIWENRLFPRRYLKSYQNPRISIFGENIFAIAGSNQIVAASAKDGKIIWSKTILSVPVSTPISDGKAVYVITSDNKTYALEASSGNLLWLSSGVAKATAIFGAANPVIYNNFLITPYSSGEIYALNKDNGEVIWSQDLNISKAGNSDFYLNDIDASIAIKNNIVYVIGNGGLMMAIDIKNGKYLWKREISGITDFWIAENFIYIINNDGKMIALERNKGLIKWVLQLTNFTKEKDLTTKVIYKGIIMAGNKLIIADNRGKLSVVDPTLGKIEQNFTIDGKIFHSPSFVDGKIYLHVTGKYTINLVEIW